jgi:hypothetical protein
VAICKTSLPSAATRLCQDKPNAALTDPALLIILVHSAGDADGEKMP